MSQSQVQSYLQAATVSCEIGENSSPKNSENNVYGKSVSFGMLKSFCDDNDVEIEILEGDIFMVRKKIINNDDKEKKNNVHNEWQVSHGKNKKKEKDYSKEKDNSKQDKNIDKSDNEKELDDFIFSNFYKNISDKVFPGEGCTTVTGLDIYKAIDFSHRKGNKDFCVSIPLSFFEGWYDICKDNFSDKILVEKNHDESWTSNPHECALRFFKTIKKETNFLDGLNFKVEKIQEDRVCPFYKEDGNLAKAIVIRFIFF